MSITEPSEVEQPEYEVPPHRRSFFAGAALTRAHTNLVRARASSYERFHGWPSALLIVTVLTVAPLNSFVPMSGLDASWHIGLSKAWTGKFHWGPDFVFTYGPWGFLDLPSELSRSALGLGILFSVISVSVLWTAAFVLLGRMLPRLQAAGLATVITMFAGTSVPKSSMLFAGIGLVAFAYVGRRNPAGYRWVPALVGVGSAFMTTMKFSEGMVLVAVSGLAALFSGPGWWRRLIETAVAAALATTAAWLLAGQRLSDYPTWLHGTIQIASGYTDAMGDGSALDTLFYSLFVLLALVVIGYLIVLWRDSGRTVSCRLGLTLMSVLLVEFAVKQAARNGHNAFAYVYVLPVAVWFFVEGARRTGVRFGVLAVVMFLTTTSWLPGNPGDFTNRWGTSIQLATDYGFQQEQLKAAAKNARVNYNLSPTIQKAIFKHPLTVDSFEIAMPWAYGQTWVPAPIMQTYSAYTPYLDQVNANAIAGASPDRRIARSVVGSIGGLNALWDSPRYVLTEMCSYQPVASDKAWLVLGKRASSRCSAVRSVSRVQVKADERIPLPTVGPNSMLLMSFHADKASLVNRLGVDLVKSFHPLRALTANKGYRLPRALAVGPLIATVPANSGWPASFVRSQLVSTVGFTESGYIDFSVIDLGS